MKEEKNDCLELLEKAHRKVKLAKQAVDNGIDEGEGQINYDAAEGILMTLKEATGLLEELRKPFAEKWDVIAPILESAA